MEAKSLWHIDDTHSEIRFETLTQNYNSLSVESAYSAISLGTESLVALGKIPVELHHAMQVPYQSGAFSFPIKYGYSLVGQTTDQRWVHVMHPHQNRLLISESDAYFLSTSLSPMIATQLSNMETVINALWASKVSSQHTVLVCGLGSVGILLAQTLKTYIGAQVFVSETHSNKKKQLLDWGFQLCDGTKEYNICFNVSANAIGLQYCIEHTVTEGKIMELSWYGTQPVTLNLGTHFHYKRLQLISVQVSEIPLEYRASETYYTRKQLAEQLLLQFDYAKFITQIVPFDSLPVYFNTIRNGQPNNAFITIVHY